MGRHSRKGPAPAPAPVRPAPSPAPGAEPSAEFPYEERRPYAEQAPYEEQLPYQERAPYAEPSVFEERRRPYGEQRAHDDGLRTYEERWPSGGYPAYGEPRGGHPEQREPGGAWGAGSDAVYGDWRGVPRAGRSAYSAPAAAVPDTDTPAFGTPAVGFPRVTLPQPAAAPPTSTGPQRLVPGPRAPVAAPVAAPAEPAEPLAPSVPSAPAEEPPASGRGRKGRAYTGMAAAAVTTALAVVVAVQMATDGGSGSTPTARSAGDTQKRADPGKSAASRSDGRATPAAAAPAQELSYEQKMAQQFPVDEKLKGPGTFDTVPGVAPAPGKGKKIRYRVDVEQGLGLDAQLFAEAVHRTLNDDRSWGHGGTKTFERVPGGEADFVITLASPGTTGVWCAKSDLDTTVDNVSCDSASTDRVMINAFRWGQGSATYGADQMFAYRQMLINHEVGHRLGHGHVNCQTPGALAPIMQQQTKSLDIGGIQCKPNPWVFPGS